MSQQDLTADMLTRIRNAARNRAKMVRCLNNKLNRGVAQVLKDEGYIKNFEVVDSGPQGELHVEINYGPRGELVLNSIDRMSKPGRRVYRGVQDLPKPLQGMGIAVVSTNQGVLSDRKCREVGVGGEVIAIVT